MASDEILVEMRAMMTNINNQVQGLSLKMDGIDQKFTTILVEVQKDVKRVKTDLEVTKHEVSQLSTNYADLDRGVQAMDNQLQALEFEKMEKMRKDLEHKIAKLNEKHLLLEKHERKYNIFIYGLSKGNDEEKNGSVRGRLHKFFVEDLGIPQEKAREIAIANAHRVPTRARYNGPKGPDPIIVRFLYYGDKQYILSQGPRLAQKRIRMLDDLPVPMKEARGSLATMAYHIRQEEKLQTRIKVDGVRVFLETRLNSKDSWQKRKEINVALD